MKLKFLNNKAFTLMEIMIVVAIIGLLLSISMPNISKVVSRGKKSATIAEMNAIKLAIKSFKQDIGFYPQTNSENKYEALRDLSIRPDPNNYPMANLNLWRGPYMDTEFIKEGKNDGYGLDSWGTYYDYYYIIDNQGFLMEDSGIYLRSAGPDVKFDFNSYENDDIEIVITPPITNY